MRMDPVQAGTQIVRERYPDCELAILGGSASRGEHTEQSDLDILIIERDGEEMRRRIIESYGWNVELFILSMSGYREDFDAGIASGNPTLVRITAEGIVLRATPEGEEIREEARADLDYGPFPLTLSEIDAFRYMITDYMTDLRGARRNGEVWFTVQKIMSLLGEFVLRANRQWTGEGKMLFRQLNAFDPGLGEQLELALASMFKEERPDRLLELCEQVLAPYGGSLFVGYEE